MNVSKNENEGVASEGKKLYIGVGNFKVVAVNPTVSEMYKLLGVTEPDDAKEIEYTGEKDGVNWVLLNLWLEADIPGNPKFTLRYRISDKPMVGSKSSKQQYVAQNGESSWALEEKDLMNSFKNWQQWDDTQKKFVDVVDGEGNPIEKNYREAIMGEADLYQFLKVWLSHVDWRNPSDNNMLIDKKKLFRDPVKYAKAEYSSLIGGELVDDVIGVATVYVGEKDGKKVQYQNLSKFWLANGMKDAQGNPVTSKKLNNLMQTGAWTSAQYDIKRWHKEITDVEYGIKENYILQPLQEYDETKFINEGNETLVHSEGAAGSVTDTEY